MDAKTPTVAKRPPGKLVAEGKTKRIHRTRRQQRPGDAGRQGRHHRGRRRQARCHSREGPARQPHHLQRLPPAEGLRPAGRVRGAGQRRRRSSRRGCTMLPYEVVTRREAHGSYLKRHPHIAKGQLFPQLLVEFYLKTKDKDWKGKPLVADDPLMDFTDGGAQIRLLNPAKPVIGQEPFLVLPASDVSGVERRVEDLSGDAAHRPAGISRAREGVAARGRHAGRSQGRVRLRQQGPPAARRRHRQRFLARDRGRLLHRQAGLSRRRRARRRRREIPPRRRDHRPLPAAAPAHHPVARIGERQDRPVRRRRSAS